MHRSGAPTKRRVASFWERGSPGRRAQWESKSIFRWSRCGFPFIVSHVNYSLGQFGFLVTSLASSGEAVDPVCLWLMFGSSKSEPHARLSQILSQSHGGVKVGGGEVKPRAILVLSPLLRYRRWKGGCTPSLSPCTPAVFGGCPPSCLFCHANVSLSLMALKYNPVSSFAVLWVGQLGMSCGHGDRTSGAWAAAGCLCVWRLGAAGWSTSGVPSCLSLPVGSPCG